MSATVPLGHLNWASELIGVRVDPRGLDKKFIHHSTTEINDNSELVHNSEVHKYIAHCTLDPGPAWPCVYSLELQTVK